MLVLRIRVVLSPAEDADLERYPGAVREDYRAWLLGVGEWELRDVVGWEAVPYGLEIVATKRGSSLAQTPLALEQLLARIPVGTPLSLQVTVALDRLREGSRAFPHPGDVCDYCGRPYGNHAPNCPLR